MVATALLEEVFRSETPFYSKLLISSGWLVAIFLLRALVLRTLRGAEWSSEEERQRWRIRTIQAAGLALVAGFFVIWATELHAMALGAVAFAAALAISLKELVLCITGSFLRTAANTYSIGDRIEVSGLRGDVIDYGLLTTTLMEVGPAHRRTGRAVTFPNAILMSNAVINESFTEEYVLHTFEITLAEGEEWEEAERFVLSTALEVCADDIVAAEKHMARTTRKYGLSQTQVQPRVAIRLAEGRGVTLLVRIPAEARNKGRREQAIVRAFLRKFRVQPKEEV